jgi:hypothetical protein
MSNRIPSKNDKTSAPNVSSLKKEYAAMYKASLKKEKSARKVKKYKKAVFNLNICLLFDTMMFYCPFKLYCDEFAIYQRFLFEYFSRKILRIFLR